MKRIITTALAPAMFCAAFATGTAAQDLPQQAFKVVGTWSNLNNWKAVEHPLWTEIVPERSNGKISATLQSVSELGLNGTEVIRFLQLGLFDFAHALAVYVAEDAVIEGVDIAGVAGSVEDARKATDAYFPIASKKFEADYKARILGFYSWPTQLIYCNGAFDSLADLAGRKIRVQGASQGDFVEGLGATGVTMPFGEVVPALQRGTVDCAITGAMPAYQAGWHEVTTHMLDMPVGVTISFAAVSLASWNKMDAPTQTFIQETVDGLADSWWDVAISDDREGRACMTGQGTCTVGTPGTLVMVVPTDESKALREKILTETVLRRWADRCGSDSCTEDWNATIGAALGLTASGS
ncbi:TRAP transporter substrate-binding protein [Marinibacterium sp. SX1]|uniref:TRAP transporter substrate-binding protein n=1 Tax=Marinibacterium sp. SX1 TaxID=3388424 RepID=UPI003D173A78